MIEIRCFDSLADAAFLRNEVNALNRLTSRPDPFSTFEFFETFFRHDEYFPAGKGLRLWFLTAFSAGELIGYLALKQVTRRVMGMQTSTISFLVTHDTDRPHLVAKPELQAQVSEAFYRYLLERKQHWSMLEFQQQDATSSLFPPPNAIALNGYLLRQWPSMENCTVHIRWNTLREYLAALNRKFRANIRRQMNNLLTTGNIELLISSDPAITPALLELYLCIEPRSWKSQAKANIGRHPKRVEYFKALLDPRQSMRISIQILLLDGVPVAGLINGSFMQGLYALHVVYDDSLSRFAPGSVMFLIAMRQAIDGRYRFLNLLSGFGYFKVRWLAQVTETHVAQIYRVGSLLFWHRVCGDWLRRLSVSRRKTTPVLFNPTRRGVTESEVIENPANESPVNKSPVFKKKDATINAPSEHSELLKPKISTDVRARCSALLAEVRKGQCELLTATELTAVMLDTKWIPEEKSRQRNNLTSTAV